MASRDRDLRLLGEIGAAQVPLGGEIIYWERPGGGRVFNVGAIGAGWTLAADGKLAALVANALHHFGVPRPRA